MNLDPVILAEVQRQAGAMQQAVAAVGADVDSVGALLVAVGAEVHQARVAAEAAGALRTWQADMSVRRGETVISSLDSEDYRRVKATGGGAVDPADDIANYVATSYTRVLSLGGMRKVSSSVNSGVWAQNYDKAKTPAVAAGARTLVFSAAGRGELQVAAFYLAVGASTVSIRFELVLDGRTLFDRTDLFGFNRWLTIVGAPAAGGDGSNSYPGLVLDIEHIKFRRGVQLYMTPVAALAAGNDLICSVVSEA